MKNLLILFLSLILFSVSCGADNIMGGGKRGSYGSGSHSKSEVEGTWINSESGKPGTLRIDSSGNLITGVTNIFSQYFDNTFSDVISGRIDNSFDYPYTTEVKGQYSSGYITFNSSSSCFLNIEIPGLYYPLGGNYAKK